MGKKGTICGDENIGATNNRDFINKFIQGVVQCGKAPIVDNEQKLTMIPVDWVAENIIHAISERLGDALKLRNFHVFNESNKCMNMKQLVFSLESYGYEVEWMEFEKWKQLIGSFKSEKENVLFPLVSYFSGTVFPSQSDDSHFDKSNMEKIQKSEPVEIKTKAVLKWLRFFQKMDIIPPATL